MRRNCASFTPDALKRFGYNVLLAGDGEKALETLSVRGRDIQLLLTDVVIPKLGGVQLAQVAKSKFPSLKILCMSGYINDPSGKEFTFEDLKFAFIQKPFDTQALVHKIKDVLKS